MHRLISCYRRSKHMKSLTFRPTSFAVCSFLKVNVHCMCKYLCFMVRIIRVSRINVRVRDQFRVMARVSVKLRAFVAANWPLV